MPSESPNHEAKAHTGSFGPVKPQERIALLDVLRGFAILGILFVNNDVAFPHTTILFPSALEQFGERLILVLGKSKLWPLFGMLYGVGFAIQLERAHASGRNIIPLYLRRQVFLALIGLVLLSVINVAQLLNLAILGVPMLFIGYLLRDRRPRSLLFAAALLLPLMLGPNILQAFRANQGSADQSGIVQEEGDARLEEVRARFLVEAQEARQWNLDKLGSRVRSTLLEFPMRLPLYAAVLMLTSPDLLFYMLVGLFLWRIGVFKAPSRHRRLFTLLLLGGLLIGLPSAVVDHLAWDSSRLAELGLRADPMPLVDAVAAIPTGFLAAFLLPLSYIAGFSLFVRTDLGGRVFGLLAPVGRTALSNYALQALLPALIFGAYTPGLPKMALGVWGTIGVLVLVASFQVWVSHLWLRSCLFGPLEWLWRTLTYWKLPTMRPTQTG